MSEDFWDTLKLATLVLKTTVTLLYNLLLELDIYYSKPIKGLDEAMRKKMHNVFMSRWSAFHALIHSAAFAMDKQFCRREMGSKQVFQYVYHMRLRITVSIVTDNIVYVVSF